ncbi:MAG: response regulator [Steroidobacter sp.]
MRRQSSLSNPKGGPEVAGRRPLVLVLESDRPIRALVSEWLDMAGYGFMDGRESGVAWATADLVLVDVRAPLQAARETIEGLGLAMPHASIIAMSADALVNGRSAMEAVARELGVAAVLVKPFGRDALMQALERVRTKT